MARRVDRMPPHRMGRPRYNWDAWFDGSVWELESGTDFEGDAEHMRVQCYVAARRRGMVVHTTVTEDKTLLYLIATPKEET